MDVLIFSTIMEYCGIPSLVFLGMTCKQAEKAAIESGRSFVAVSAIDETTRKKRLFIVSPHLKKRTIHDVMFVPHILISLDGCAIHNLGSVSGGHSLPLTKAGLYSKYV